MPSKIQTVYGNVLDFTENAVMIHGCNCQGVMGSGVALAVREKYPDVFADYRTLCNLYADDSSRLLGDNQYVYVSENHVIVNAMTQDFFGGGRQINYEAIYLCFERVNQFLTNVAFEATLYFPKIGAGLGGGNWEIIKTIIEQTVDQKFNPTLVEFSG
jgi:O-acetyl-ADP-ribose deacetylase (regulator of RNase III)